MDIVISQSSQTPLYLQIYDQVSTQILNGKLKAGEKLPSLRHVATELRVSIISVKGAWEKLEADGFVVTAPGRGVYVAEHEFETVSRKKEIAVALLKEPLEKCKVMGYTESEIFELIQEIL